jgi:site-specific DNA-adenine methylase
MKSPAGTLAAPFPYFGGKALACSTVWAALGDPENYVEPFGGSAAMLLGRPNIGKIETINDADGFVANFWRAVSQDAEAVAKHVDWPTNEADLFARHSWLVRHAPELLERLHADPDYYDAKVAGWWCWGACNWIGSGWCSGDGPWVHDGEKLVDARQLPHLGNAGQGVNRKLPHLSAGRGVNRQLPHLSAGRGVNRQLPHLGGGQGRTHYIYEWFGALMDRMRDVRVAVGDWQRVLAESVTTRHGTTGVFLDPPYTNGAMDYAAGGVGGELAGKVRAWCAENGHNPKLRIVLCGHAGEHDALLQAGWHVRTWTARKGYARTDRALANTASETLWCSPHCVPERMVQGVINF